MTPLLSLHREGDWSIGLFTSNGATRFSVPEGVRNPILSAAQVTDVKADFEADPFLIREKGTWYLFFEV